MTGSHVARCLLWALALAGCAASHRPAGGEPAPSPREPFAPFAGVLVRPSAGAVELEAAACLGAGWLEQVACSPNSREHESLVVVRPRPSEVHAALVLAGFAHGSPGNWSLQGDELSFQPPTGDAIDVWVRYLREPGGQVEEPIRNWIEDGNGQAVFPQDPWIFAGSSFRENPQWMGPGEHYEADMTGSIVGLVTFGDEVVGFSQVLADQEAVQPPLWQVRAGYVPPSGTPVTLILRRPPAPAPGEPAPSPSGS